MSVPQSVSDVIGEHVRFELESIDRMYLNVYQPMLQTGGGVSVFFRGHRREAFATAWVMARMTRAFVTSVERFAQRHGLEIVPFPRGIRKEGLFKERLLQFDGDEGVVMVGKAQEKATVYRTTKRRCAETGRTYPWLTKSTAMVNHYYFYCVDKEFGPFFIKFCSYFPYNARLCINGHEYVKRQLLKRGIGFEASENAILACDDPAALQRIADGLSAGKIEALLRRWLPRLPHPFTAEDRRSGFRYELSILQSEFALTQVRKLENLTALREMAFTANRRLLHVQQLDHDPTVGEDEFQTLTRPTVVDGQRASGLKFGDPVVLAVLTALLMFRLLPRGFSNRDLRDHVAQLLARSPGEFTPGQMSYQLRRLRLKGLIARIPRTHRYEVTEEGLRAALFYTGSFTRVIRPLGLALGDDNDRLQERLLRRIRPLIAQTCKPAA